MAKRTPIPTSVQNKVLVSNRHACCVCQKDGVQLHHIDGDPSNNDISNLAALCLDHHDRATMIGALTKKLTPTQVRHYKQTWEARCADDIRALSRKRLTFYYCIYKNPPRIIELYRQLTQTRRQTAVDELRKALIAEQGRKDSDNFFGLNAIPQKDDYTAQAILSIYNGELYPSYLRPQKPHPADPNYSSDCSNQEAMATYHMYDLWSQVAVQTLALASEPIPVEDLYKLDKEEEFDGLSGRLVSFRLTIYGKDIHIPRMWKEHPVGQIHSRIKKGSLIYRVRMSLRTHYLFSDTAAINLSRGRVAGIGMLQGAVIDGNEIELTLTPLLIGTGGLEI